MRMDAVTQTMHKAAVEYTPWTERNLISGNRSTNHDDAVRGMLNFVEERPHSLAGHLCFDPR
jgi:hypothetical protein